MWERIWGIGFSHNYDHCTLSALSKYNANIINQPNEKHVQKKQGAKLLLWSTGQQVYCVLLWFRVMCERAFVISKMQLDQQLPKGDVNYAFVTSFLHCLEYIYFIFKLHLQIKIHFITRIAITAYHWKDFSQLKYLLNISHKHFRLELVNNHVKFDP